MNTFVLRMTCIRSDITLEYGSVVCYRWGTGPEVIIALHGFGEQASSFAHWGASVPDGFSLYAPDLPLHGESTWREDVPFTNDHLHELFRRITGENFILCGYSMGGRLCLSYIQAWPERVDRLVLLAPDGLKVNFWYWLASQTRGGNDLFRYTMAHPGWFLGGVRILGALRLINRGVVKYVQRHLGKPENRRALYHIWTCMRTFRPDLETVRSRIRDQGIPVRLVFGRFDRIIQTSQGQRFQQGAPDQCQLLELSAGHQLLTRELTPVCLQVVID